MKKIACILKFENSFSNSDIAKKLPLSENQLKDAFSKYKKLDFADILIEKRGAHKKKISLRTNENINLIRNIITNAEKKLTPKQNLERFQNENTDVKCSKSLIHKIIKEDLGLKYGISKAEHAIKNSDYNKAYRTFAVMNIVEAFIEDDIVISIDETGFSSYVDNAKLWFDPLGKSKLKISKKNNQ